MDEQLSNLKWSDLAGANQAILMNREGRFLTVLVKWWDGISGEFAFNGNLAELRKQCDFRGVTFSDHRSEVR